MEKSKLIVFLGVDGSGKSTLIDYFYKKNKSNYKKIHFVPDFFRKKKNKGVLNPHKEKKRNKLFSLLKLFYWTFNIKFSEILQTFSKKNYIYDRNLSDVLIDPIRYRFSLSKKTLSFFLSMTKKPDLYVYVAGNIKKIHYRKKETSLTNLFKLDKKYKSFLKNKKNKIFINGLMTKEQNYTIIRNKINFL